MRVVFFTLLVFGLSSLVLGLSGCEGRGSATAPPPRIKEIKEGQSIPLGSIYSTSRQKGLKLIKRGVGDEAFANELRELYQQSIRMGASNVFLARGDDIAAAVKATWEVFTHGRSASEPVSADRRSKSERYWLVAYLGVSGSGPPAWLIKSATVSGRTIRLAFTKPGASDADLYPYCVWVPLGKLGRGTFTLELFDEERKEGTLSRRVILPGE